MCEHVSGSEDSLQYLDLFSHYVGLGDWVQEGRHGGRYLYLPSRLPGWETGSLIR